ncbi:MAG: Glu-tRNA(Gln) amidotransferase subunit GatE [Thaumarchaeota archaeon]|nr:Glu-tRNA(Gln) amidotransferase subunit GatE [Nitrososphaerota archaeon]
MSVNALDLSKCDLKVGIEVHQQLATGTKLFCSCPPMKSEELPLSFERRLRPSQSELGRIDAAAVFEFNKGRVNLYRWNPESSCLVDADEEPPHPISAAALETVILISEILGARIIDEIHVMRKIVIDGSNTTGFQRTAVVGLGGSLAYGDGKSVGVQSTTVEEDAARALGEDARARQYALDRLGVPLVEIALEPIPDSPEGVERAALQLGRALRSTGRVARGLGTIRQDLNVSVKGGEVVEVKGVQKLNLIAKVVRYEATRQMGLLQVAAEAKNRSPNGVSSRVKDVTETLKTPASPVLKKVVQRDGARIFCASADALAGLLGFEPYPGIRVGKELGEIARTNGLGGVIHSDEFRKQGVTEAEDSALRAQMGVGKDAALVLVAGEEGRASTVAVLVKERLEAVPRGVLRETRAATEDGETRFLRPRPGAARMYPETDIPDIVVSPELVARMGLSLPVPWEQKVRSYSEKYSLSGEMAVQLYDSDKADLFENLAAKSKLDSSVIASILVELPARLAREGVEEMSIDGSLLSSVVLGLDRGLFAKEGAYDVLRTLGKGEVKTVEDAVSRLGIASMDDVEVERIVSEVVERNHTLVAERGERAFSVLMGEAMKLARGKADGGKVSAMIRRKMQEAGSPKQGDGGSA